MIVSVPGHVIPSEIVSLIEYYYHLCLLFFILLFFIYGRGRGCGTEPIYVEVIGNSC